MKILLTLILLWVFGVCMLFIKGKDIYITTTTNNVDTIAPVPTQPMRPNITKPNGQPSTRFDTGMIRIAPDTLHPMH